MSGLRRGLKEGTIHLPPMDYRLVPGKKGRGDLRLDWRWADGYYTSDWRPVELDHTFLIADIIAQIEDITHPYPQRGGAMVFDFIKAVRTKGWRQVRHDLHLQRMQRDLQRCAAQAEFSSVDED